MTHWQITLIILGLFFSTVSFFPLINATHWVFRVFDFIRLQLLTVLVALLILVFFCFTGFSFFYVLTVLFIFCAVVYHVVTIMPYFPKHQKKVILSDEQKIVVLSINVKQENKSYKKLIDLVNKVEPDIFLTMETDKLWEKNLEPIESSFKSIIRVPQDNRYGMHIYTKLEVKNYEIHYLISKEHPSIKVTCIDKNNNDFVFWGIHPPPPSPTEKTTSKQKDAELMKVAKYALDTKIPMIVSGDFNNVCWSKTSRLFSKISKLKDARIKRGFYSTFPANYWLLRFPIDLLFHSNSITISKIKVLASIGSDHLPLLFKFYLNALPESKKHVDAELIKTSHQIIKEGEIAAKHEN